jgi:hypothetical protein
VVHVLQHVGELTFFVTLLNAVASRQGPVVAADTLLEHTVAIRSALQNRLAAVIASPPALAAVEYFTLLAQIRELLSRARELAATLVAPAVRCVYLSRLSALQDGVLPVLRFVL